MICTRCFAPIKIQLLPLSLILRIRTEGMEDLLLKIVSFLSFHISPLQVGRRGLGDGMQSPEPWEPKFFSRRARRLGMRKLDSWDSINLVVPLIPIVPLSHPYKEAGSRPNPPGNVCEQAFGDTLWSTTHPCT